MTPQLSLISDRAADIAERVERFVRDTVVPHESDPRRDAHGPSATLVAELRQHARDAGVLTPHILENGVHLTHVETALVLRKSGLSPLGPMTKAAVGEALFRIADRCVQIMGGTGITGDTIVAQVFRETRAFRIYDGPTEVHKWSLAKKIKRKFTSPHPSPVSQ